MDNNNNGSSQSWTDPITGEVYPSGNPHVSLGKSVTVDPSVQVRSFRDPDPEPTPQARPMQEVYPQGQTNQFGQPVQNVRRVTVQQVQINDPNNIIPRVIERQQTNIPTGNVTKFCEHCGSVIARDAVVCPTCGCQVAAFQQVQPAVIINNNNILQQQGRGGTEKDKWVSFLLCLFLGTFGAHRFYEGKIGSGILYMFTFGLFGIGWFVDIIRILTLPDKYYV